MLCLKRFEENSVEKSEQCHSEKLFINERMKIRNENHHAATFSMPGKRKPTVENVMQKNVSCESVGVAVGE
jgi:hypothetical protein